MFLEKKNLLKTNNTNYKRRDVMGEQLIRMLMKHQDKLKHINKINIDVKDLMKYMSVILLNNQKEAELKIGATPSDIVKFNIGGTRFSTYKTTLDAKIPKPNTQNQEYYVTNLLEKLANNKTHVQYDENKAIFIDRDPTCFNYILNFLRAVNSNEKFDLPKDKQILRNLLKEAEYYELSAIKDLFNLPFNDSLILDTHLSDTLVKLCHFSDVDKWKLLYRGSLDGYRSEHFHLKCDHTPKTLTIIKSNANIFGGYTETAWDQSGTWKSDPKSFLFSLVNKDHEPIKMDFVNFNDNLLSCFCHASYGPTFGHGCDLYVADAANLNDNSCSNLGFHYKHPKYEFGTKEAKEFLAGSYKFIIDEIEIYSKE